MKECDDIVHVVRSDGVAELIAGHERYGLLQRRGGAVVKVRCGEGDIAQRRDPKYIPVFDIAGNAEAAKIGGGFGAAIGERIGEDADPR